LRPQTCCDEMICGMIPPLLAAAVQPLMLAGAVAVEHPPVPAEPADEEPGDPAGDAVGACAAPHAASRATSRAARHSVTSGTEARQWGMCTTGRRVAGNGERCPSR